MIGGITIKNYKKLLLSIVLIFTITGIALTPKDIIQKELSPHMSTWRTKFFTDTILQESSDLHLDPLLILALMKAESNYKNVFGDSGKAVGYFQLHKNAVVFVQRFYPELEYVKHENLPRLLKAQIQIACRYIWLINTYITFGNIRATLDRWNGSKPYGQLSFRVLTYYAEFLQEVTE
ncbi:MAG TPA: hypothetical protein ENG48_03355 [Candidatus Atribacteria bacterium]|nr:hypothetical protein [Candidatus Atribacteria bacterium]